MVLKVEMNKSCAKKERGRGRKETKEAKDIFFFKCFAGSLHSRVVLTNSSMAVQASLSIRLNVILTK